MATLVREGLELRYEVRGGSGPALLLPHLNFSWPDVLDPGAQQLASGLDRRGSRHVSFPARDREGMLAHLDDTVPRVLAWLDQL